MKGKKIFNDKKEGFGKFIKKAFFLFKNLCFKKL